MAALSFLAVGYAGDLAPSTAKSQLGPVDTYFVTQTSLATPFQVDSGRLAQSKGGTQAIRSYAELMVGSHIAVNDAQEAITKRKTPVPPPTLLKAAYATMISGPPSPQLPARWPTMVTAKLTYQLARRRQPHASDSLTAMARHPGRFAPGMKTASFCEFL